jgi:hypothetical protein
MQVYDIRGVPVGFPFNAYDSQRVYMEKVIQSLQEVRTAFPPSNDHPPWALSDGPHRARTRCWRVPQALARRCVFCVPLLPGGSSGSTPSPTQHNPQPTSPLVRGRPWLGVVHLRYNSTKRGRLQSGVARRSRNRCCSAAEAICRSWCGRSHRASSTRRAPTASSRR